MYSPQGIRLRSSARTSTGQVRENNEDNIHLFARDQFVLAIVADGMGGAAAGEEASRIAVETIHEDLTTAESNDHQKYTTMEEDALTTKLKGAIRSANLNIVKRATVHPELKGMGTTVTLAIVRETDVIVAHVGDSRAYLVNGDESEITQLTSDHSFVEALVAAGHITREEAEDHPMKNVLYRALGQAEDIDVDMYYHRLRVGDRLVLCSDGLTRHVKPPEIAEITLAEDNPDAASQKLVDLANSRGGEDNISVVVIKVEQGTVIAASQNEATGFMPDDDTILLKDRVRFSSTEADTPPYTDIPPKSSTDTPVFDDKDDFFDSPTIPGRSALMRHILHRPSKEADGEGRDTSAPEH
jgi:PPM family protein phosphatase